MGIKPPIQHHIQRNPDAMSVKGSWRMINAGKRTAATKALNVSNKRQQK